MTLQEVLAIAEECGFSHSGEMNVEKLELLDAVREMCAADRCKVYGHSWSCPPACGTLDDIRKAIAPYKCGVLVQTTGDLEDEFDIETIEETGARHKENFLRFVEALHALGGSFYPMSAGTCTLCTPCAYPEPCRFPDKRLSSMEACGIFVSRICEDSGLPYYYGKNTMTYTSCVLF